MIALVSSTDSVVWLMKASLSGLPISSRSTSSSVCTRTMLLRRLAHRPLDLLVAVMTDQHDRVAVGGEPLRLDMNLRDERAGRIDRSAAPRAAAFACTLGATPCAENTVTDPGGTSVSWSTKIAPRARSCSTTCLLWTISLRT